LLFSKYTVLAVFNLYFQNTFGKYFAHLGRQVGGSSPQTNPWSCPWFWLEPEEESQGSSIWKSVINMVSHTVQHQHKTMWKVHQVDKLTIFNCLITTSASVLWHCWLGGRKGILPVKKLWWGSEFWHAYLLGARCRYAHGPDDATAIYCLLLQQIQIRFTFLVLAHLGSSRQSAIKWVLWLFYLQPNYYYY